MKATTLTKRALNTKTRKEWLVDDGKQRGKQIFFFVEKPVESYWGV